MVLAESPVRGSAPGRTRSAKPLVRASGRRTDGPPPAQPGERSKTISRSDATVYTIEMAYAHMRSLQELANRSRSDQPAAAHKVDRARGPRRTTKKR